MLKNFLIGDNPPNIIIASRLAGVTVLSLCALSFWALLFI